MTAVTQVLTYTTPSRIPSIPQMDTKGSKNIKEVLGVLNWKFLALIPIDARKKKNVEKGQATQEHAMNDPMLVQCKHFTYLTLLLVAALTINQKHPSLGNVHAPMHKLSKECAAGNHGCFSKKHVLQNMFYAF